MSALEAAAGYMTPDWPPVGWVAAFALLVNSRTQAGTVPIYPDATLANILVDLLITRDPDAGDQAATKFQDLVSGCASRVIAFEHIWKAGGCASGCASQASRLAWIYEACRTSI